MNSTRSVQDIDTLRATLDDRLATLEAALADPGQHAALEQIILELARVATEEAEATARAVAADAERKGERAIDSLRQKLEGVLHDLENERAARASHEGELSTLRQALQQSEQALHQRDELIHERDQLLQQRDQLIQEREQALRKSEQALQAEREAGSSRVNELAAAQQAVQQEQKARAADLRKLKDSEAVMAAARRELEQVRSALEAEKAANAGRQGELAKAREAVEKARAIAESQKGASATHQHELDSLRQEVASLRQALDHSEAALNAERQAGSSKSEGAGAATHALEQERAAHVAVKQQLDETRTALEGARAALDTERATSTQLREKFGKLEQDVKAVRKQAEARSSDSGAQKELEQMREELESTKQTFAARGAELQSIIDASESRIRSLELAVRDADERANAAERAVETQRKASSGAPPPAPAPRAAPHAPPSAAPPHAHTGEGPVRAMPRTIMAGDVDIQVDGSPAKLIDLSMTGAQILASVVMKPNRMIKLILPLGDKAVTCKGKVVWARLEPKGGQIHYRAGVVFTASDAAGLEQFLQRHGQ